MPIPSSSFKTKMMRCCIICLLDCVVSALITNHSQCVARGEGYYELNLRLTPRVYCSFRNAYLHSIKSSTTILLTSELGSWSSELRTTFILLSFYSVPSLHFILLSSVSYCPSSRSMRWIPPKFHIEMLLLIVFLLSLDTLCASALVFYSVLPYTPATETVEAWETLSVVSSLCTDILAISCTYNYLCISTTEVCDVH